MSGELLPNHTLTDYDSLNIPWLKNESAIVECPPELAIIIHGWSVNETKATERFDRANMSLQYNNYHMPIIGFSWDSNTGFQWVNAGWTVANLIAKENGPKLARFIIDFKENCTDSVVRIIAHSLGSRVVLSTLDSLNYNQKWNNEKFNISSVHLVGAAVDDEEIANNPTYIVNHPTITNNVLEWYDVYGIKSSYGTAIEDQVEKFYNLFNTKDKTLSGLYGPTEQDRALGLTGVQLNTTHPSNYNQTDIKNKMPPLCDADGDGNSDDLFMKNGSKVERGDNHAGYFGFRNATNNEILVDDGAMNTVVRHWNNTLVPEKPDSMPSAICQTLR